MELDILARYMTTAAIDVFETMLEMEISPGEVYIENSSPAEAERVVALIGIAGSWIGNGMISCAPEFACKISSSLLMTECPSVNEDVLDAMAEMVNMIFGNVKTEIEERVGPLGLSIPTVIFGRNFATRTVGHQKWTVVPIQSGTDIMELRMFLTKNNYRMGETRAETRRPSRVMPVLREEVRETPGG